MTENKEDICVRLLLTLRATREGRDLASLRYDPGSETVTILWDNGAQEQVNVACDSGIAMVSDILAHI